MSSPSRPISKPSAIVRLPFRDVRLLLQQNVSPSATSSRRKLFRDFFKRRSPSSSSATSLSTSMRYAGKRIKCHNYGKTFLTLLGLLLLMLVICWNLERWTNCVFRPTLHRVQLMGQERYSVGKFIQLMSTFLGAFAIAFVRAWDLTIVMIAIIPPLGVAASVMAILVTKISSRQQEVYAKATVITEQTIGSIRTVASFTGERKASDKYKSLKSACSATVMEGVAVGIGTGVMLFFMFSGYSLGLWFGGKLILSKGYTGGKVFNAIFAVLLASFTLGQASSCLNSFALGRVAGFKIFETIKRQPEIDAYDSTGKVLDDIQGSIELRDIVFSYPTRPAQKVFDEFSLSIPSGISVALVGESGSGKSTVISLIERFYDPQSGEVLIDGINLKKFQLRLGL